MKSYLIRKCMSGESKEGWIWISKQNEIQNTYRNLIRITATNQQQGSISIIVSQRVIDQSYKRNYNKLAIDLPLTDDINNYIIMSDHYRKRLKINLIYKTSEQQLQIERACYFDFFTYLNQHPNEVVAISYRLAIVSMIVGLISLIEPALHFFSWLSDFFCH